MNPLAILIVDDDPDDVFLLLQTMEATGRILQVNAVKSGREALEFLETREDDELPDLVLLDYNTLPLTGPETLKAIAGNRRFRELPVTMWGTSKNEMDMRNCLELGAIDYFIKPSTTEEYQQIATALMIIINYTRQ